MGWGDPAADDHFEKERNQADDPTPHNKNVFYKMTCAIGKELDAATGAISASVPEGSSLNVLDLCMAPGGFTTTALANMRIGCVCGVSLPVNMGGYEIRIKSWKNDPRIAVEFLDITMLAAEMGVDIRAEVPTAHPDVGRFLPDLLFQGETFNLVFCGGTVVRKHNRPGYRGHPDVETIRLQTSQLVVALTRINKGGTLVLVLHRADSWTTVALLHLFSKFAELQLFKPKRAHARRSSFYMVARNVQPQSPEVGHAIEQWKKQWRDATLGSSLGTDSEELHVVANDVRSVLDDFGETLIKLSTSVFRVQADALRRPPWNKKTG